MDEGNDFRLETRQGRMAGLGWRREGAPRVLALHGWLDNAASFVPLAPLLERLDLVALDLPGHGHSEHRHTSTRYHFIDYLFNIDAALDALGWADCHLIGHSMGASIAATYAAGAPERVRSLVLLDGLGPLTASAASTADRLRRSLQKNRQGSSEPRRFESLNDMVEARRRASGLAEPAARLICQRSARQQDRHFVWRSDPALNWVSALRMTEEQVLDLLQHIECPTLTYQATPESTWFSRAQVEARKSAIAHGEHLAIEGHHHFHMDAPAAIAETVQSFISRNDRQPKRNTRHE
jgi:pimeloyl-ACP methyl ester carboxylesterase